MNRSDRKHGFMNDVFYVIGKCSNVVRSQGEFAGQILLESSLLSDDFLYLYGEKENIDRARRRRRRDL